MPMKKIYLLLLHVKLLLLHLRMLLRLLQLCVCENSKVAFACACVK